MGVTVIRDNVFTDSGSLASALPSSNATYSVINDAQYIDNQTVDVTVWLKGYLLPKRTSKYEFSISSNGGALLYLSTDDTPANKVSAYQTTVESLLD